MATTPIPPYDPNPDVVSEPSLSRKVVTAAEEFRDMKVLLQRCLKVPAGETVATLPGANARKSGLLGFDASTGQPIIINVDGDLIGVPGPQGEQGIPGTPGQSQYFHIAYADSADGSVGFNQVDGDYIGTYVDTTEADSTNYADYSWKLFSGQQGPQGIPGVNGANGQTSYFHIKYSNDGGATFTANVGEDVGSWIGTYVDFTSADSTNVTAYKWKKIEGGVGPQGSQGTPGAAGANGQTSYFHVAYANSADGSVGFNQTSGQYIGTYVDFTAADSNDRTKYTWRLLQGSQGPQGLQGIPGTNGATGAVTYLHIKYSNDGGTTLTANSGETPGSYLGTYTDTNVNDSNSPSAYTWAKIQGDQGPAGTPGTNGQTTYFHVAYANNSTGTVGFNQTSGTYIGTYVDFNSTDSNNPASYSWKLLQGSQGPQGNQGIPGLNGDNGQTSYLHIKYSNDGGASFTGNGGEDAGTWIGTYSDFNGTDSTSLGAYSWVKIQGPQGNQGPQGPQGNQGVQGNTGAQGPAGQRGSVDVWATTTGTSWNSSEADSAVAAAGYGSPVNLDKVTLVNAGANYVETRYRSGAAWITFSQVIDGNLIVKGTVAGDKLVVSSVTADKIRVTSRSLNPDPMFEATTAWVGFVEQYPASHPSVPAGCPGRLATKFNGRDNVGPLYLDVQAGETYKFSVWVYRNSASAAGWVGFSFSATGADLGLYPGANTLAAGWTLVVGEYTIPSGTARLRLGPFIGYSGNGTETAWFSDFQVEKKTDASLIVDGTITANKLVVNSVTAAQRQLDIAQGWTFSANTTSGLVTFAPYNFVPGVPVKITGQLDLTVNAYTLAPAYVKVELYLEALGYTPSDTTQYLPLFQTSGANKRATYFWSTLDLTDQLSGSKSLRLTAYVYFYNSTGSLVTVSGDVSMLGSLIIEENRV